MSENEVVLGFSNYGITYYGGECLKVVSKHPISEKNVSYENFIDILNSSMKISYDSSKLSDTLPAGTVLFDYKSNDANTGIDIDRKVIGILVRKKRVILLFHDKPLEVAIPNLLFTFSIDNGKYSVHVNVVLDKDIETNPFIESVALKKNYELYPLVFPNSYDDGRVCWGNANLPTLIKENCDYYEIIKSFFLSSFNSDLLSLDRIDVDYLMAKYHADFKLIGTIQKSAIYELFLQTIAKLDSFDDKLVNRNKTKIN